MTTETIYGTILVTLDGTPSDRAIIEHIKRLREDGVPMLGLFWWPAFDQVDWDGALTHRIGKVHEVGLFNLKRQADGTLLGTIDTGVPTSNALSRELLGLLPKLSPAQETSTTGTGIVDRLQAGAARLVFASGSPLYSLGSALMSVQFAALSDGDRAAILGDNLSYLLTGQR